MESMIIKLFATGLALSQVVTAPDEIKTGFDRDRDQPAVAALLQAGCNHMRKAFGVEDIDLDDLITTAMDDPQALGESRAFRGLDFNQLLAAYRQFCKGEPAASPAVDLGAVIEAYNRAAADLPDHTRLEGVNLPGASLVLDRKGERFAEVFEENARRVWVQLAEIPEHVIQAFVAAEDQRFFEHQGIDERGLIRAFIANMASSGRPQGGSTITQQVAKNLLVGDDLTYERKLREILVASRIEQALGKERILELYLNSVYLGRSAWGIELAARGYFGKPARDLTLVEGAFLAGLTKGPSHYDPDRHPARAQERLAYVLSRLRDEGVAGAPEVPARGLPALPALVAYERPRRDTGYYFIDQVAREAKAVAGIDTMTAESYTVRSTLDPALQRAVEEALQEGLWRYERGAGRLRFRGAEANLARTVTRIEAGRSATDIRPAWQRALLNAHLPLYDVHWTPALVVQRPVGRNGDAWRVGLGDGRILPLAGGDSGAQKKLKLHDVVLVRVAGSGKSARAELRIRPLVQGAVIVLENKSGRILAMSGGFSYPLSQLNRATQAVRQPGSAIKPLTYLAALGKGLQPNTLVSDETISLPPVGGGKGRERDTWTPSNYDGDSGGTLTLRAALERSRNLATAHLLDGGIAGKPEASLERLCELALEAKIYRDCLRYYPFVLGAQPVRLVDLAAFFAAIANEGLRPTPHVLTSIEHEGRTLYRGSHVPTRIASVDNAAFYQLKSILQGVLARGTARSIADLAPYVGGKTGTTDDANDAWFVGFTNEVTVAVWIGYDNADGKRRTLGGGATGGSLAVPIFSSVIQAVWAKVTPRTALAPPSAEARQALSCKNVSEDDRRQRRSRRAAECLRVDGKGRVVDTRSRLVGKAEVAASRREPKPRRASRPAPQPAPGVAWQPWGWGNSQDWLARHRSDAYWSHWR
jgi:membrane carboxypeptidase/penicillin-binding protein